mgnify:CR=1 FL=1
MRYRPTPVQELVHPVAQAAGVRLLVKREDLNNESISGNKWWKLKYNIEEATQSNHKTVLTFGGAFSNHIYATAACAYEHGLKSIGVIRGEEVLPLNPTLAFARTKGMILHFISREEFRTRSGGDLPEKLHQTFGDFYLIPEGGTNALAVKGCAEFANELRHIDFDGLCLAVGTGGTMAGLISAFKGEKNIIGASVLKNGEFLNNDIARLQVEFSGLHYGNWKLLTTYHQGGYARVTKELLDFVRDMKERHNLPLDHIYTAKALFAALREIESGAFPRGTTLLFIHTGGLQGVIKT